MTISVMIRSNSDAAIPPFGGSVITRPDLACVTSWPW